MRSLRRASVLVTALLVGLAGCSDGGGETGGDRSGEEVTVRAMNLPDDPSIAVLMYLPQSITINRGTTVSWALAGPEPHSVTFYPAGEVPPATGSGQALFAPRPAAGGVHDPAALINSGLVPFGPAPPAPFRLRFDRAGSFRYYCVIHPQMIGTVDVVPRDVDADTQDEITHRADRELRQWTAEGREAKRRLTSGPPVSARNPDGTITWTVEAGITTGHIDVLHFSPVTADIRPGDSIRFVNSSQAPHTATFGGGQPPPEDPASPEATQPWPGPSPQVLNPTDRAGTGTLPPAGPAGSGLPVAARSFIFVVTESGEYPYVCVYHRGSGMGGMIRVA
ncbi:MAG TPA: hypothetical protein VF045_07205 [Acidimicrobiales bacterium]